MAKSSREIKLAKNFLRVATGILCACGVLLSFYAYHVELKKEEDDSYTAMCDISEHMSCTTAFSSKYGKGFGLLDQLLEEDHILIQPNSVYGIFFYSLFVPLSEIPSRTMSRIMILVCILSNLCSVYLAYILMYVLYDLCIVCVSTYLINAALLVCSAFRYKLQSDLNEIETEKKES